MARRFIVNESDISYINENVFEIVGSEVKHIQVLRHNVGENITVNNHIYKIIKMKKDGIILERVMDAPVFGVPNIDITLYIAMLKGEKMDFVIQKAVELGCSKVVPFLSLNTVVKLDEKQKIKKQEKFQKIADEACKQCGRTDAVEVFNIVNFKDIVEMIKNENSICLFAYENENSSLNQVIQNAKENIKDKKISCIIGAEGGFDKKEASILNSIECVESVSLGNRILRAETAAISLLSVIMYEFDN